MAFDRFQFPLVIGVLFLSRSVVSMADSRAAFCDFERGSSALALRYQAAGETGGNTFVSDDFAETRQAIELNAAVSPNWQLAIAHEYTILDLPTLMDRNGQPEDAQSNGHQHTFHVAMHGFSDDGRTHLGAAVAVSSTSNGLKNPEVLDDGAVQLWFVAAKRVPVSDAMDVVLGVCADRRFGEAGIYPVFGMLWQFAPGWQLKLAFPETDLRYSTTENFSLALSVEPAGNEWRVYDKSLKNRSRLQLEAWQVALGFDWELSDSLVLLAAAGRMVEREVSARVTNNTQSVSSIDDSNFAALGLRWEF